MIVIVSTGGGQSYLFVKAYTEEIIQLHTDRLHVVMHTLRGHKKFVVFYEQWMV